MMHTKITNITNNHSYPLSDLMIYAIKREHSPHTSVNAGFINFTIVVVLNVNPYTGLEHKGLFKMLKSMIAA